MELPDPVLSVLIKLASLVLVGLPVSLVPFKALERSKIWLFGFKRGVGPR